MQSAAQSLAQSGIQTDFLSIQEKRCGQGAS
jgi:hypothetical protein